MSGAATEGSYSYFEHDADVGVIGRGDTLERAFEAAARAAKSGARNPTWCWTVPCAPGEARAEVRLYDSRELLATMDDKVLEQITNVARLPGLAGAAMTMPDAHWGYGFPIGGVAAFDPDQGGIISAGGVGFDISCGIRCLRTNLDLAELAPHLRMLADRLFRDIPAGVGEEGELKLAPVELDAVLAGGAQWAADQGHGEAGDLEFVEESEQRAFSSASHGAWPSCGPRRASRDDAGLIKRKPPASAMK